MIQIIIIEMLVNGKAAHLDSGSSKGHHNPGNEPGRTFVFPLQVGIELQQDDAKHSVEESTGFAPYQKREAELRGEHRALADKMLPYYELLAQHRMHN